MFIWQSFIKLSSCKGKNYLWRQQKDDDDDPIIDLKRWSSLFKHHITLFLNILLVDCYVGKLLGHLHMVCIWRRPMSNLKVFIFRHLANGSFSWTSFHSKTGRPASRTQFFQGSSCQWLEKCLVYSKHFLCISSWYQFGERRLFPKLVPGWNA
jgi:hypothetical protein